MRSNLTFLAMTALIMVIGCSSNPTETSTESTPVPAATATPQPAPVAEAPKTDLQACEGKAAKDPCSYSSEKGEVKGTCVRSETYSLQCLPKKSKKK